MIDTIKLICGIMIIVFKTYRKGKIFIEIIAVHRKIIWFFCSNRIYLLHQTRLLYIDPRNII